MKYVLIILLSLLVGMATAFLVMIKIVIKPTFEQLRKTKDLSNKHLNLYLLMNDWVNLKQQGKDLWGYFEKNEYRKIAIYGMNYVGETLLKELHGSGIEVLFAIDKNANNLTTDVEIVLPENIKKKVDVIVVTPIAYFDDIADILEQYVDCPIVSIEDVIFESGM